MAAVTICTDFGAQENKACHCFHCFPVYLPWSDRQDQMPWSWLSDCWVLSPLFHCPLSPSSRRSSSLSALRVMLSAYLTLLVFLLAILIPASDSSSLQFCIRYSAHTLNREWQYTASSYSFPNFEPVYCCRSGSNRCFLTWIQVSQETGKVVWYSHLFKNFPDFVVIHIVKGLSIVNESEVDIFLEFPCFLYDPMNVGKLSSGSSAFSKSNLYICKFSVHILLKPSLKHFDHYLASVWNKHSCTVVWTFSGTVLL